MESIIYKGVLLGVRITKFSAGSHPLTSPDEPLQALALKHEKGYVVSPHIHVPSKRVAATLQECLIVRNGRVRIDMYGPDRKFFRYFFLKTGDVFIYLRGAYGLVYMEPSELLEVKNGPFRNDKKYIPV